MSGDGGSDLERAQAGDPTAFADLYDTHIDQLMRWFQTRTASADIAADLCAETFAALWESLERFDSTLGEQGAWLYGISKNQLRRWHRQHRVENASRERLRIHIDAPNSDDMDLVEVRVDLEAEVGPLAAAVAVLSEDSRQILWWRVVDELPYSVIAERTGCSVNAATVRVSRALTRLLSELTAGVET